MIVGSQEPLYQLMIKQPSVDENILHYAINGSLDILDEMVWTNQATYLKTVDEFQGFRVSAFVTPTNLKLIIAHERRNEDGIRGFFQEVHDLLIKVRDGFYEINLMLTEW